MRLFAIAISLPAIIVAQGLGDLCSYDGVSISFHLNVVLTTDILLINFDIGIWSLHVHKRLLRLWWFVRVKLLP